MTMFEESLQLLKAREHLLDPREYCFFFFGDTWVGPNEHTSNDIFHSAMDLVKEYNPLFIIHGGDIVFTGKKENFQSFIDQKKMYAPTIPFFVSVGNHEVERLPSGEQSLGNFIKLVGPLHFTIPIPRYKLTLISLDTLYHNVYQQYGLTSQELAYLRANLATSEANTFVAMHVPPKTNDWTNPNDVFTLGSKELFKIADHDVSLMLVSHVHAFKTDRYKHNELILSGGGGATLAKREIFHLVVVTVKNHGPKSEVKWEMVPLGWD
jgi:Icc protein